MIQKISIEEGVVRKGYYYELVEGQTPEKEKIFLLKVFHKKMKKKPKRVLSKRFEDKKEAFNLIREMMN